MKRLEVSNDKTLLVDDFQCLLFLIQQVGQVGIEWMTNNKIVIEFSFKVDLQAKKENELQPKRAAGPQISPSEKASGWL